MLEENSELGVELEKVRADLRKARAELRTAKAGLKRGRAARKRVAQLEKLRRADQEKFVISLRERVERGRALAVQLQDARDEIARLRAQLNTMMSVVADRDRENVRLRRELERYREKR